MYFRVAQNMQPRSDQFVPVSRRIAFVLLASSSLLVTASGVVLAQAKPLAKPTSARGVDGAAQAEALFTRGVAAQQAGDFAAARTAYEAALRFAPRRFDVLSNLGVVFARLGLYTEAVARYTQALAVAPAEHGVRLNLGIALFQMQQYERATTELAAVTRALPDNTQARQLLGLSLYQLGKLDDAQRALEIVRRQTPTDVAAAYALASVLISKGDTINSEPLIAEVFSRLPPAEAHLMRGAFHVAGRNHKAAIEELTRAAELDAKLPSVHSHLGRAYFVAGERERAAAEFEAELAINPRDFDSHLRLGVLKREDGDAQAAAIHLRRALELRPDDAGAMFQLAQVVQLTPGASATDEAVRLLERAIARAPDFTQAHVLLARLYFKSKRTADAERERAIIDRLNAEQQRRQPISADAERSDANTQGNTVAPPQHR